MGLMDREAAKINHLIAEGKFPEAAQKIFDLANFPSIENTGNMEILRGVLPYRNQFPKAMYAVEDLLAEAEPAVHDRVVESLDAAGWYGQRCGKFMFCFHKPKLKAEGSA